MFSKGQAWNCAVTGHAPFCIGLVKRGIGSAERSTVRQSASPVAVKVAGELTTGPIPPDEEICHTCDNPACCNPNDLFCGPHRCNMEDMIAKGRDKHTVGEANGRPKLTDEKVRLIRQLYASGGFSHRRLGKEFHVGPTIIGKIIRREDWKHVK